MNFLELKPGKTVEGEKLKAYRSELKGLKYLYLMAGTHGDEVEGVYALQKLFDWLKEQDDISLPTIVIPVLNVDGYRAGTRVNAHGVDLNRNYNSASWSPEIKAAKYHPGPKALSEPENQYLIKLFNKYPPRLIISFHSWKPMLNTNGDCKEIAEILERYNNYPIVEEDIGYATPGSLGDLAPEKYNSPVLTFEFPTLTEGNKTLKEIWAENEAGLITLMQSSVLSSMLK